ncbi:MAG: hypothetical protein AAFZ63_21240 [Bacteroidota bacterium]
MKNLITLGLVALTFALSGQDCQLVKLHSTIPEGVTKHHFPVQTLPASVDQEFFTYLSEWNEGELVVRLRFSNDGENWTKWDILKRDYTQPEATNSPLHLAADQYEYFEWAVYNKAGIACELALNFYYPESTPVIAAFAEGNLLEISTVGCPQPMLADDVKPATIVSIDNDDDK